MHTLSIRSRSSGSDASFVRRVVRRYSSSSTAANGQRKEKSLYCETSRSKQNPALLFRFDSLGDHPEAQTLCHSDHGLHKAAARVVGIDELNKGTIELD